MRLSLKLKGAFARRKGRSFDETRDSPRVPMSFRVRRDGGNNFEHAKGHLGLNGVLWEGARAFAGSLVQLAIRIPGEPGELVLDGRVVGAAPSGCGIRFLEPSVEAQLSIARYLDDVAVGWE
jgi:hypothetical protein